MTQLQAPGLSRCASVVSAYRVRPERVELPALAMLCWFDASVPRMCHISPFWVKYAPSSCCPRRFGVTGGGLSLTITSGTWRLPDPQVR